MGRFSSRDRRRLVGVLENPAGGRERPGSVVGRLSRTARALARDAAVRDRAVPQSDPGRAGAAGIHLQGRHQPAMPRRTLSGAQAQCPQQRSALEVECLGCRRRHGRGGRGGRAGGRLRSGRAHDHGEVSVRLVSVRPPLGAQRRRRHPSSPRHGRDAQSE
jgi:hypothetical protein